MGERPELGDGYVALEKSSAMAASPRAALVVSTLDDQGRPVAFTPRGFGYLSAESGRVVFVPPPDAAESLWSPGSRLWISILSAGSEAEVLGSSADGRFEGEFSSAPLAVSAGAVVVSGAASWLACDVRSVRDIDGDRVVIAAVASVLIGEATPLIAYRGGYGRLAVDALVSGEVAAANPLGTVDAAREELRTAADDLGGRIVAQTLSDGELVFIASAGTDARYTPRQSMVIGTALPAVAPLGALFVAWAPEAGVERWLASQDPHLRTSMRARAERVRERGFSVSMGDDDTVETIAQLWQAGLSASPDAVASMRERVSRISVDPLDFGEADVSGVIWLAVPVFDPQGRVVLVLGLEGVPAPQSWDEFERRLGRMEEAASRVTTAIGGRSALS